MNESWKAFELDVAALYEQLGYRVSRDVDRNGKQVDIECEKNIPGIGLIRFMVDCKHTGRSISVPSSKVAEVILDYESLKISCGYQKAVIVSSVPFTRQAKSRSKPHADIELRTIAELRRDLLNAEPYLNKVRDEFHENQDAIHYIPLLALKHDRTDDSIIESPVEELIDHWLQAAESRHLWLLGDFGSGKTTSLKHQFLSILSRVGITSKGHHCIPLFIQLRNYASCKTGNEIVERFLTHELGHPIPYRVFSELFHSGEIVLFCDGFDEMGEASNSSVRRKNFLMLSELSGGVSKTVISCRPAYFIDQMEFNEILATHGQASGSLRREIRGDKIKKEAASLLAQSLIKKLETKTRKLEGTVLLTQYRTSEILELKLLNHDQIRAFLQSHNAEIQMQSGGNLNAEKLLGVIADVYDLEDLSARPILLKLITDTLPWLHEQTRSGYKVTRGKQEFTLNAVTPSLLYLAYTDRELQREIEKGVSREVIDIDTKRQLVQALAYRMYCDEKLECTRESFLDLLLTQFAGVSRPRLEQIDTEFRSCSFLTRDGQGNIRFVHKSFLEYFAADELVSRMRTLNGLTDELSRKALSDEMCYFAGDLIAIFESSIIAELQDTRTHSGRSAICRINATNVLNSARQVVRFASDLAGSRLVYKKADSDLVNVENSELEKVMLMRCSFGKFGIVKSTIAQCEVGQSKVSSFAISSSKIELLTTLNCDFKTPLVVESSELKRLRTVGGQIDLVVRNSKLVIDEDTARSLKSLKATSSFIVGSPELALSGQCLFKECVIIGLRLDLLAPSVKIEKCVLIGCVDSSPDPVVKTVACSGFVLAEKLRKVTGDWSRFPRLAYGSRVWFGLIFSRLEKRLRDFDENSLQPRRKRIEMLQRRVAELSPKLLKEEVETNDTQSIWQKGQHSRRAQDQKELDQIAREIPELSKELMDAELRFRGLKREFAMQLGEGERLALGMMRILESLRNAERLEVFVSVSQVMDGTKFENADEHVEIIQ